MEMEKRQYIVLLPKGKESDPLTMTELYAMARERRLQPDGMIFDTDTRGWSKAAELPQLRSIFKQLATATAAKPNPNSMPAMPAPPKQTLAQRIAGLFGRPGGAL